MQDPKKYNIPQCYVSVRKWSFEEISRMSISPYFVAFRCGSCREIVHYGPKCKSCHKSYHYECATRHKNCCGLRILPFREALVKVDCPKCKESVKFGPQCTSCRAKFHSHCVSPYDQCCQLNLYESTVQEACGGCGGPVDAGPRCPFCSMVYHVACAGYAFECCGVKVTHDDDINYKCRRCHKKLSLGSPMCLLCGRLSHGYCLPRIKTCCGKPMQLEIYIIPSFKFLMNYNVQFVRKRAILKQMQERVVVNHGHGLRSIKSSTVERRKQKSASSQTSPLDSIAIVEVKTELEEKEVIIADSSPPVLEREPMLYTPEPSSSSSFTLEHHIESEDSLRNLFDFLYNMVKKFPPHLQTQVKIELFKTVTEAEMQLHCSTAQNHVP